MASVTDVGDGAAVAEMIALAAERFGGLDVLFSNAATTVPGSAVDLPIDGWELMWRTNVSALYLGAKHAVPIMVQRGGGAIVATASISGLTADAGQIGHAATKAAVMGLVRALAVDHARQGIRVNCICPGMTATPPLLGALGTGHLSDAARDSSPVGRLADPEEIASVALWLASAESSFVTGQAVVVDGGLGVGTAGILTILSTAAAGLPRGRRSVPERQGTFRCCRCTECRVWLQPPLERCRHCGDATGWEEVSGNGVVFSFIVVRHQTIPGHSPPYVVALVELAEQPRLRFTGLLDADPSDVAIGQPVRAVIAPIDGTDVAALRFERAS